MTDQTLSAVPLKLAPFTFNEVAGQLREQALAASAFVFKVENPEDNEQAVKAQLALKSFESLVEKAIEPYIDALNEHKKAIWQERDRLLGRGPGQSLIDGEALSELWRVGKLLADFQKLEEAKARAAEALQKEKLDALERERAQAIAQAANHDQLDAVQEKFNQKALDLSEQAPLPQPVRAKGQVVAKDWEIKVSDPYKLAMNHYHCVTISPKLGEIKKLLNEGLTVQGIEAREITRSTVRQATERAALTV